MTKKVGLIVGREWSFPPAFIEAVNGRDAGVTAELVRLGAPRMDEPCPYSVVVDRISHEVPFYRTWLKHAVRTGATVINNPFMWTADDKFFGASLATGLGIAHPKTVVLPNKEYVPGIVPEESLRNLEYPLDWDGILDHVGLPCVLKDAHGGGWKEVYVCRSKEELLHHYDSSRLLTMVVQEFIDWDHFVRCICIGQEHVLPIKYDPRERKYHVVHDHMSTEVGERVVADSLKLVRALGYDMDSMEWAIKDGVPYAIDFMNPAPDFDVHSLTPHYFGWVVERMTDLVVRLAQEPRPQGQEMRWSAYFGGSGSGRPVPGGSDGAAKKPPAGRGAEKAAAAKKADSGKAAAKKAPPKKPAGSKTSKKTASDKGGGKSAAAKRAAGETPGEPTPQADGAAEAPATRDGEQ